MPHSNDREKNRSEFMMGNKRALKRQPVMTNRGRFLGALWNALNCSTSNDEVWEVMNLLNADEFANRMRVIYYKSNLKGIREQALEDLISYRRFK